MLVGFTKGHLFAFWLLERVPLLHKLFNFALQPVKLLLIVVLGYHLSVFFSDNSLNALSKFYGCVKHVRRNNYVFKLLFRDKVEQECAFIVALIQCEEFLDRFCRVVVNKRI